jgi:hypothetical protein
VSAEVFDDTWLLLGVLAGDMSLEISVEGKAEITAWG